MSLCDSNDWDNDIELSIVKKHFQGVECPNCGYTNRHGEKIFCKSCGSNIEPKTVNPTEELLRKRGKNYGDFKDTALITQQCEEVFKTCAANYYDLKPVQREALHMILQKLARAANGNWSYDDSWVDIGGYSQLVVDYLNEGGGVSVDTPFEDFGK